MLMRCNLMMALTFLVFTACEGLNHLPSLLSFSLKKGEGGCELDKAVAE
jgi:hypothetical protein